MKCGGREHQASDSSVFDVASPALRLRPTLSSKLFSVCCCSETGSSSVMHRMDIDIRTGEDEVQEASYDTSVITSRLLAHMPRTEYYLNIKYHWDTRSLTRPLPRRIRRKSEAGHELRPANWEPNQLH